MPLCPFGAEVAEACFFREHAVGAGCLGASVGFLAWWILADIGGLDMAREEGEHGQTVSHP